MRRCQFSDDTVMTYVLAKGLRMGLELLPDRWMDVSMAEEILGASVETALQSYNSWGNGSITRASYAGWVARTLKEAEMIGDISDKVTHTHPEGIKGARVIAGCIFLLRCRAGKAAIREYAGRFYNLVFPLDEMWT